MNKMLGVFLGGAAVALTVFLRGFVLRYLWLWFVVPLGVPEVTTMQAIGISLLVGLFTTHLATAGNDGEFWTKAVESVFVSLLAWALGWILHSGM